MKKVIIILLTIFSQQSFAQIYSPNGNNIFTYNGAADVTLRFEERGNGGRAMVHAPGNVLAFNFDNDFTGGTTLGSNFRVMGNGEFRSNAWQPFSSTLDDFYLDVESGTRILRTRNWNTATPNIAVTGIHTGSGYFESAVGIGTATPSERLSVNGNIRAREIKVETSNWPDYVFEEDYKPLSLPELERYIAQNKHLPEVPSASEAESNGISLGEMNKLLLKKIEELTLLLISIKKENDQKQSALENKISALNNQTLKT